MKKIFLMSIIFLSLFILPVFAYEINITSPYDDEVWNIDVCLMAYKPVYFTYDVPEPDECYYEVYNSTELNFNITLPDCIQGESTEWDNFKAMYFTWFTDNSTQHTLKLYMNDTNGNIYYDEVNFTPNKTPISLGNLIFWSANKYGDTWFSKSLNTFWGVDYGICGFRNLCNMYVNEVSYDNQYTHSCGGGIYLPYIENANNTIRFEVLSQDREEVACRFYSRPLSYPHELFCDFEPIRIYQNETRYANIIIDTILPQATINEPFGNYTNGITEVNLNYEINELYPKQCSYSLNNETPINLMNCENTTISGLTTGSYELRLYIEDLAGNTNEIITYFNIQPQPEPQTQTSALASLLFLIFGVVIVLVGLNYVTEITNKEVFIEFAVIIIISILFMLVLSTLI